MKNTHKGFSLMAFLVVAMIIGAIAYYYFSLGENPTQDSATQPTQTQVSTSTVRSYEYDDSLLR
jgi:hypothetical protein